MRILGFEIGFKKALNSVDSRTGRDGWLPIIREPFAGAWQQNKELNADSVVRFSAVFACVTGIASDIAKLQPKIMTQDAQTKIWVEAENSQFSQVLRRPNGYQNRIKFLENWVLSKLLYGNTYALKVRDVRGAVVGLQLLSPVNVTVLVDEQGGVYYQLRRDDLAQVQEVTIPASEIIHDRGVCLYHPLVGVSPLYAASTAANIGLSIQDNSDFFFTNKSAPGGVLTAPARINDETAARLKSHWESNYSGKNAGKVAVLGDGLKFEQMTMSAVDAALVDQLKLTVQDIARAFRYPLTKLQTGETPISNNIQTEHNYYYADCLQPIIESMELCLDEGLGLPNGLMVELDLEGLSRMDTAALYQSITSGISGGFLAPNEGRRKLNLPPVEGGDSPFLQQQNYAIEDLSKLRTLEFDAMENPPPPPPVIAPPMDDNEDDDSEEVTRSLIARIQKGLA
jgi:HK97 family phage portal protein